MRAIDFNKIHFVTENILDGDKMRSEAVAYLKDVLEIPTLDVKPVIHSKWILDDDRWVCSVCGYARWDINDARYCEWCGADMKGGEQNETY